MAGKITATTHQINDSATATNNFVLKADNLGGLKLSRGTDGATSQDILEVDTNGVVMMTQGSGRMVLGTAQATTSGTSIDFTGIPSWVKRITVMLNGVSTNGTSIPRVQLGVSGSPVVTGYLGSSSALAGGGASNAIANFSAGFDINSGQTAASVMQGALVVKNITGNTWECSGVIGQSDQARTIMTAGTVTLSGTLNMLRLTTVNGTDTFDAGSVNIMYEG